MVLRNTVSTNDVSIAFTRETSINQPGTDWIRMEPNDIPTFGETTERAPRNPISPDRQERKGAIVDRDSAVGINSDLTLSAFSNFIEGFMFARGIRADVGNMKVTEIDATNSTIDLAEALTASQAASLPANALIYITGAENGVNNGYHVISTDASSGDNSLSLTTTTLVTETNDIVASAEGYRVPAASTATWAWDAATKEATLTITGVDLNPIGLHPGSLVRIGSTNSALNPPINGFQNLAANDMVGVARVIEVNNGSVVFDKVAEELQFTDATDPATPVDILFGWFVRNVGTDDADFLRETYQFEAEYPGIADNQTDPVFEYARGNAPNTLTVGLPITANATIGWQFVGTSTQVNVQQADRKTGADAAEEPIGVVAMSSSSDVGRLRITDVDEDGLSTDFLSAELTITNNITPIKAIGKLGSIGYNLGNFNVNIAAQMFFTNAAVIERVQNNATVTADFIMNNEDGLIAFDFPSLGLDGGGRTYNRNEAVSVDLNCAAHSSNRFGTSLGVSVQRGPTYRPPEE